MRDKNTDCCAIRSYIVTWIFIGLWFAGTAEAGGISIRTRMTLSVLSDRITVKLEVNNTGDEDGRKVNAVLYIFDEKLTSKTIGRLGARKSHTYFFEVGVPEDLNGQFAFIGEVVFHDRNMHPYSAISAGTFLLRNRYPTLIQGHSPDVSFEKKGPVVVNVKNTSPRPQTVTAILFLPYALTAIEREKQFQIDADAEINLQFELKHRHNIGSAVYPFFCVLKYEENENHHAVLVKSKALITEPKNWFIKTRWYWLIGLEGIIGLWAVVFVILHVKRKREGVGQHNNF